MSGLFAAAGGTEVIVAFIGAFAVLGGAGLAVLGKWLDARLDQKAAAALKVNTEEHGVTKNLLTTVVETSQRVEQKIDNHIAFHAHQGAPMPHPSTDQHVFVHHENESTSTHVRNH